MKAIVAASTLVALTGCASTRPVVYAAREATEEQIEGCEFLGTVTGSAAFGRTVASETQWAIRRVSEKAARLGATHFVLTNAKGSGWASNATGRAYRCEEADQ